MKRSAAQQILAAAATLPARMARRITTALQAASGEPIESPDPDDHLELAADAMTAALEAALLAEIESFLKLQPET